ncbi:MAG TPA: malate synthase G, partial [Lamprocystis sp. (in: g-proteobacteria)]|nr:malate synthase G [Lamprocystis sp. (in: g-proteobacteria)]
MIERVDVGGLKVAKPLYDLVKTEIVPGTGIAADGLWQSFGVILAELAPRNRALLAERDALQGQIDAWHLKHRGQPLDLGAYRAFLAEIGYLVPEGPAFHVTTANVDAEIASIAGPQLVVPVSNARYALNAANARWGSLYDALYGTDVISDEGELARGHGYNPVRGAAVIARAADFLDQAAPLAQGTHRDAVGYRVDQGALVIDLPGGAQTGLQDPTRFTGYRGEPVAPTAILLANHGLHVELQLDRHHPVGEASPAGVADVLLESAVTTIEDCEDSVAAVDTEDKVGVYRNWLGLMKGTLTAKFSKGGKLLDRALEPDRTYTAPHGGTVTLPGRALMLVRNVGHLMTNDAVLLPDGSEVPEGMLDCLITSLCAVHDLQGHGKYRNSRAGSIYIVKPKMHGPAEAQLTVDLFARVEDALGLARNTIKIGIMDEERRTTVNLLACIRVAKERVIFINTGFLARTG